MCAMAIALRVEVSQKCSRTGELTRIALRVKKAVSSFSVARTPSRPMASVTDVTARERA